MKKVEDFKKAAKEKNITEFPVHNCSMCNYSCGYIIRGDVVTYDNGCYCSSGGERESTWEDLADSYNRNAGASNAKERAEKYPLFLEGVIKKDNKLWGFENPEWVK